MPRKTEPEITPPRIRQADGMPLWAVALIFCVTLIVYSPAIKGGFIWDDDMHVTRPELRSLHGLFRIWFDMGATAQYYPLVHSLFWIQHRLWGDAVIGYHLLSIVLHATSACLAGLILSRLKVPGAILAATIFSLHPVHVESVAWISELKNTLSGVFYLGALLAYLSFDQSRRKSLYAIALLLFVMGLLSKTVTSTLPGAMLVIFWWQRGRLHWRRDIVPLVPWFALGVVAGLLTAWVELNLIGAVGEPFKLSLAQRGLIAGRVVWFYLAKLLWPKNLIFIYPRWEVNAAVWWQYLFPLGLAAFLGVLWMMRRHSRSPLAAMLFFIGTLFPALGFVNVYPFIFSFVADHFQYLASLGVISLSAAGMTLTLAHLQPRFRLVGQALCAALLITLAILTTLQCRLYRDVETLYRVTIDRNPGCWMAYNNLGAELSNAGRIQESLILYQRSAELYAGNLGTYSNLGIALIRLNRFREAMDVFESTLRSGRFAGTPAESSRTAAFIMNNLAWLYACSSDANMRNGAEALRLARRAVDLSEGQDPSFLDTLAAAYAEVGRFGEAVTVASRAVNLAQSTGQSDLTRDIQQRLGLYRSGQPYRESLISPNPTITGNASPRP
jgi:protein O-mannosyl-transferase